MFITMTTMTMEIAMLKRPRMKPAFAQLRFVASPASALFMRSLPKITARMAPIVPRQKNQPIPITSAAVPNPFCGAAGEGCCGIGGSRAPGESGGGIPVGGGGALTGSLQIQLSKRSKITATSRVRLAYDRGESELQNQDLSHLAAVPLDVIGFAASLGPHPVRMGAGLLAQATFGLRFADAT
jgi:hypothetical protein